MNREEHRPPEDAAEQGWDSIAGLWRQQPAVPPVPAAVIARVRRQERWLRVGMVTEWLVAAALCGFALTGLIKRPDSTSALIALLVFALVVWALVFSIRNRKGLWQPLEETTSAYRALVELRLERRQKAIRFAWLLYAVELLLFLAWEVLALLDWLETGLGLFSVRAALTIMLVTAVLACWSGLVWWHCRREKLTLSNLYQKNSE